MTLKAVDLTNDEKTPRSTPDRPAAGDQRSGESSPKAAQEAGVLFRGVIYGASGYADANLGVVLGLDRNQVPVQLEPFGPQEDKRKLLTLEMHECLERMKRKQLDLTRSVIYQCAPANDFDLLVQGCYRVGRTYFETDGVPDGWVERCQSMDEMWMPSHFNRETFAAAGVDESKLRVMHEGVDTTHFRPEVEPLRFPHTRSFNFLSVFDWQTRKGFDVLLRAYLAEFKPDEDVALILKIYTIYDPFTDPEARLIYFVERELGINLDKIPPIIILNGFIPNADMPRLYAAADAFVLPSRGEGFGRPYLEALSCGRPVIATRWSAQLDFLHDGNSYLIEPECIAPVQQDQLSEIFMGHRWAEPSVDHLRQLMRQVFSHPEEARQRAARGRAELVERWDWSVVSKHWANEVRRLLDGTSSSTAKRIPALKMT